LERAIMEEKCTELEKAGIIVPAPRDCHYASNAIMLQCLGVFRLVAARHWGGASTA
jgi:hypothetical protein